MDKNKEMNNRTKLRIFDFDGTLISTPLPDVGKVTYKEQTGKDWPHSGWWGRRESLDLGVFEMTVIEDVHNDYHKIKNDEDVVRVMMTGRITPLSKQVELILEHHELEFDEYHYNTFGSTEQCKIKTLNDLLVKYPNVIDLEMWDDRIAHVAIFQKWGDELVSSGRLEKFNINLVPGGTH